MNFFILGYPRSRTAWLANFFTYGGSYCFHEAHVGCGTIQELKDKMSGEVVGNSDSGCTLLFDEIRDAFDSAKFLLIVRDRRDVEKSMDDVGLLVDGTMEILDVLGTEMDRVASSPGVMVCRFDEIDKRIEEIWPYCTGLPFDRRRYDAIRDLHIEVDVLETIRKAQENRASYLSLFGNKLSETT